MSNITDLVFKIPKYTECYAGLASNRIIFLSENVSHETASALSALLFHYDNEDDKEDITIYINTNGGDAMALANIYDVMQIIKSPIKTICIGKAYSAGALILASGTKGKRYIAKNASVMMHGLQASFPMPAQDTKHSEIMYNFFKNLENFVFGMIANHTGKTLKEVQDFLKEDRYFDAKSAVDAGIVDKII